MAIEPINATEVSTDHKKRGRKPKAYHEQLAAAKEAVLPFPTVLGSPAHVSPQQVATPPAGGPVVDQSKASQQSSATPQAPNSFLSRIQEYAIMQTEATGTTYTNAGTPASTNGTADIPRDAPQLEKETTDTIMTDANTLDVPKPLVIDEPQEVSGPATEDGQGPIALPVTTTAGTMLPMYHPPTQQSQSDQIPLAPKPPSPIMEGYATKNLVILDRFGDLTGDKRQEYSLFYNSRKTAKPVRHSLELCPITMQPAKYRDPSTGIGYANMFAYKILKELKEHKFKWSSMLGCYVGREGAPVARGVPEGFHGK